MHRKENGQTRLHLLSAKADNGQVLLIVVLVMIIALTVGLSLVSRSITNLRSSTEEVYSKKALSAAEAGVEQAIENNVSIANGSFPNDPTTSFKTDVTEIKGTEFLLNGGNVILQDEGIDLWLSDYSDDPAKIYQNPWSGDLILRWGDTASDCNTAALEIQLVLGTRVSPRLTRFAFDPCPPRSSVNHFTLVPLFVTTVSGKTFYFSATINVSSGLLARIVPLYTNSPIAASGSVALPSQGFAIDSLGVSGTTQRKITVFKGYQQLNIQNFSYGLFAP